THPTFYASVGTHLLAHALELRRRRDAFEEAARAILHGRLEQLGGVLAAAADQRVLAAVEIRLADLRGLHGVARTVRTGEHGIGLDLAGIKTHHRRRPSLHVEA